MALANSGLGLAHGVAAALGIHAGVAHGLACAVMLPVALATNRGACQRAYCELSEAIGVGEGRSESAAADALVERITQLGLELKIPKRLSAIGVTADHIPSLVRDSRGNSMSGNPRAIDDGELTEVLTAVL
jgi:alcohol dehydrogenase class IV